MLVFSNNPSRLRQTLKRHTTRTLHKTIQLMNTNPAAKRILCYGDSNTRGYIPGSTRYDRYPANVRWTGVAQDLLGAGYEVIEEGLGARLTKHEDDRPGFVGKNGLTYLLPCLETHTPLDLVIIMLGTPDLKERMDLSAEAITEGMRECITCIQEFSARMPLPPKILLMSPVVIDETVPFAAALFKGGTGKSKQLGKLYAKIAEEKGSAFLDLAPLVQVDPRDGIHLSSESHQVVGEKVATKVREILCA